MVPCRRVVVCFCYGALFVELLAAHVLDPRSALLSPTAGSDLLPGTTTQIGFFKKIFHAAKELVWNDSSNVSATSSPLAFPSPTTASTKAQVQFVKAAQTKEVAAKMNFSLRVLNEDLSVVLEPDEYVEGSAIYLEARVQASPNLSPKLFIDECYGTDAQPHNHPRKVYIIADNHGCLYSGSSESTWFRKEDSVMVLKVPAFFLTGPSDEIYIHCFLKAWNQKIPSGPSKKACYFDTTSSSWKNIDEPSKTSVCACCNGHCSSEPPLLEKDGAFWGEGRIHKEVAGPLIVRAQDAPWLEGQCRTMKKLLLVSVAFVSSSVLAALFVGALVALVLAVLRYSHFFQGHRRLKETKVQPFQTELQAVVGALAVADEAEEKETNLDYCKLNSDSPDKV